MLPLPYFLNVMTSFNQPLFSGFPIHLLLTLLSVLSCPCVAVVTLCWVRGQPSWSLLVMVENSPCAVASNPAPAPARLLLWTQAWSLMLSIYLPHSFLFLFSFFFLFKSTLLRSVLCLAFIYETKRRKMVLVLAVFVICGTLKMFHT